MLEGERTVEIAIDGVQEWGDHLLQVDDASIDEHMSRPFSATISLVSDEGETVAGRLPELIGRHAILRVEVVAGLFRYFSGIITSFTQTSITDQTTHYTLEMVPWLWFLGHRRNYRIFQFEAVPAILATIFREWLDDLGDRAFQVDDSRLGDHPVRDYCVQYDETDLEFVERLMEEEGVGYFFQHSDDGHMLVLVEDPGHHQDFALPGPLRFSLSEQREVDSITALTLDQDNLPTAHAVSDYHFENPNRAVLETSEATAPFGKVLDEVYVHPAGHAEPFVGKGQDGSERLAEEMPTLAKRLVKLRVEGAECEMIRARGGSLSPLLSTGHLMDVEPEPGDFETGAARGYYRRVEGQYLLISVSHQISGGGHRRAASFAYSNTFEALPQKVKFVEKLGLLQPLAFRPPRLAEKPRARGPETAVVVGPEKEEIWTDKYGRVKVQFFWDRREKFNEESSCWVRVAQPWAGKRWGAVFIPRIGQEVIVDFLGGDPDRPIITGSVYNADQMPPYLGDGPDPNHKHDPKLSGIKSNSTPDGKGFNEIRFDDTKDKEQVFIHAQRRMDQRVRGTHRHTVGGSYHVNIGYEDKEGGKHGDLRVKVKKDQHHKVEGDVFVDVAGEENVNVAKGVRRMYGDYVADSITNEWGVSAGKIIFEATQSITFAVGNNFVEINPAGVTVNGALVQINCVPSIRALPQNVAMVIEPEDPDGADTAKPGFVSNPKKGNG
jgi:type VI secretion system secreted protein VgrG